MNLVEEKHVNIIVFYLFFCFLCFLTSDISTLRNFCFLPCHIDHPLSNANSIWIFSQAGWESLISLDYFRIP